jgi:anti-sigma factor RsiW
MSNVTCAEFEILLADLLDGNLAAGQKAAVERHQTGCAACAELARDAASALAFIERAAEVAPPPALVSRIQLATAGAVPSRPWMARRLGGAWTHTVLQPRFAMGMAMAVLSLAVLGRFGAAAENGIERAWDRTVKNYDSLAVVYDVQTQLQEWRGDAAVTNADTGNEAGR